MGAGNLREQTAPPAFHGKRLEAEVPVIEKEFSFFKLADQWPAFCDRVVKNGESGGAFLGVIRKVEVEGHCLTLTLGSRFYEAWLEEPDNRRGLENTLRYYAVCPADMQVRFRVEEDAERVEKTKGKLRRRYDDRLS